MLIAHRCSCWRKIEIVEGWNWRVENLSGLLDGFGRYVRAD